MSDTDDLTAQLAIAQRRLKELEARDAEHARSGQVQQALYRIAELASGSGDLPELYRAIHAVVAQLIDARNLFLALYDAEHQLISWPYYVDSVETDLPEPDRWEAFGSGNARGMTARILTRGGLEHHSMASLLELSQSGAIDIVGDLPADFLGVPLTSEAGAVVGVLVVQSYEPGVTYTGEDEELLTFVARHVGGALSRARAIEETRQRNAELALINSVQEALAGELDLQAIYEVVGERIRDVFDAQVVDIAVYDETSGRLHFPYTIERGVRFPDEPIELIGYRRHVMETSETLVLDEPTPESAAQYGNPWVLTGEPVRSALFVPLVAGGASTGVLSLQNLDRRYAFSRSDQQLLETLAASLGVALENARLVHETRQRNAQLALINSVQAAIAGELDPQAIYDDVGAQLRDAFDAQVVSICVLDGDSGLLTFPYVVERGERLSQQPLEVIGFRQHVLETREPLMLADLTPEVAARYGNPWVLTGEPVRSALFVPLVVAGRATGVVSLQNLDRPDAFGADDLELLTSLTGSLSVALENARLLQETRQRVAELATVNRVGEALAAQLDLEALIQLVGEQVQETFEADIAYVALHDRETDQIDFVYYHEGHERRDEPSIAYGEGVTSQIIASRAPLLRKRAFDDDDIAAVGTPVRSFLGVPILLSQEAIGAISVQSIEDEGRFSDADARLLATIAANVGVAIQKARLFAEVERQRQHLESLVAISPAAVVVMDTDERVSDWNPAAAELFGYRAEEALGQPISALVFSESDTAEGRELIREAMANGRAGAITRRRRKDGSPVDVELMLAPLSAGGAHVGFLAIYHDVTELQRARQDAEAATQAKSAFLATMSHEIRTPMNAVIGMTELLLGTALSAEQRSFAEVVQTSGDALLHVIDDILDYSKIEAGKLELESTPLALRECVEGALDMVAPRAWDKQIELGCLIDEDAPAGILGDVARLRQVLLNLLSNAVKFTESGEVTVLVHVDTDGPASGRLQLVVRDTGIGIPADRMDRLFASFSQVDASTTRRFGGTGLGLAISRRLVELMGGSISVESVLGQGSTFTIELPVTPAAVPTPIPLEQGLPRLTGKQILVVDDNATNREIVVRHARSWSMHPVAVEGPTEALALLASGASFDVAVLDMMMPEMDGLGLAREIRRRHGDRLPLVLLSSLGRVSEPEQSDIFAAEIAKPLKASQLYNALLGVLHPEPEPEPVLVAGPDGAREISALRVLLAEDNPMNQMVALRLLERLGYSADVAANGLQALEALENRPYDVVLMDVQMPELDGLDATRRICARWAPGERPHIIAMTANAMAEDREACLAAGMNDYVAKPVRSEALAAALARAELVVPRVDPADAPAEGDDATPTPAPVQAPISFDDHALQMLRDLGGNEFLVEVIDTFIADAPDLIVSLRGALDRGDGEELRRVAHTLKSNGATLGAVDFAELCRAVEQRARDGELDGILPSIEAIERGHAALEVALNSLRSEPVTRP